MIYKIFIIVFLSSSPAGEGNPAATLPTMGMLKDKRAGFRKPLCVLFQSALIHQFLYPIFGGAFSFDA
jgi:hypothetical protein